MRKLIGLLALTSLAACGGGGGAGPVDTACSNDAQKQFVLDALYDWYLWNDMLPANIDIANYSTPEQLVIRVTEDFGPQRPDGTPLDRFSFVGSALADQQFFGEGKFEGFGFSWRLFPGDEMRFLRVFADGPAGQAGFERGQRVLSLNGRSIADWAANEGVSAALDPATVQFEIQRLDGSVFTQTLIKDIVTIDPVPNTRLIDMGAGVPPLGYMELATFISTADPEFATVFGDFIANGVTDVVIDLRYNGGGLVRTAELLGDYLGGLTNDGRVFSKTVFNADRALEYNRTTLFTRQANSVGTLRLIVIASRGTASASELVTNSLAAWVDVWIVGDNTFGKPVGQVGIEFCEKILRPTAFMTTNALDFADYFDGLPVDCVAEDDLDFPTGSDDDPNIIAARAIASTGACPAGALPGTLFKAETAFEAERPDLRGPPEREFANAY